MRAHFSWKSVMRRYADGGPSGDSENNNTDTGNTPPDGDSKSQSEDKPPKTFTQEEVNRMMAREKNEGKRSILKELGVENLEEAKTSLESFRKQQDAQKSAAELAESDKKALNSKLKAAEADKATAEAKLALFTAGCNKEYIDEALVLVQNKVKEGITFEDAVTEVKNKIPTMFEVSKSDEQLSGGTGTGGQRRHSSGNNNSETLATTLAKQRLKGSTQSSYFKKG